MRVKIKLTLKRDMLGTNPGNPNVMDAHVIEKQRKLILEEGSKVNKAINKYLDNPELTEGKKKSEIMKLVDKLEATTGYKFSEDQKALALAGKLEDLKETFEELDTKGVTVFFWDKEKNLPCIGDHMIYGFMKAAAESISRTLPKKNGTIMHSASYTQSIINQHVRCDEQFITFDRDLKRDGGSGKPEFNQRSLRAQTAQGPRVSLAKSEVVPAGANLEFVMNIMDNSPLITDSDNKESLDHLHTLFGYGKMCGLGQWRNAGWGMFDYELKKVK